MKCRNATRDALAIHPGNTNIIMGSHLKWLTMDIHGKKQIAPAIVYTNIPANIPIEMNSPLFSIHFDRAKQ